MTVEEFRSNPILVAAMRDLLRGDGITPTVLAQAVVAIQGAKPTEDAKDRDPEIVSVRKLSKIAQHDEVINLLLSCAEPMPAETDEGPALFGVDPSKFQVGE